ncbi:hypothetical protein [Desulfovibrio inopinatus]|uniref:hypothetical protein n=1 Tax=Desulfovibrio inopinatus TaxID=102109 RepID=UPI0004020ADD|nr:hypothetical protein [Desulfovibrio inopinatus]
MKSYIHWICLFVPALMSMTTHPAISATSSLDLQVKETAGASRNAEIVRSGIPPPVELNLTNLDHACVRIENRTAVASQLDVLGRYNAGKSVSTAPIQWLLASFPATVSANQTTTYRLFFNDSTCSPSALSNTITVSQDASGITVNTGAASFRIGDGYTGLFSSIQISNSGSVIMGGATTIAVNGQEYGHVNLRDVTVKKGDLATAVTSP